MKRKAILYFVICCIQYALSWGQSAEELLRQPSLYEKNGIQYKSRNWFMVSGPKVDVYFTDDNQALGEITARFAEEAYYHFANYFDYKPFGRFRILATENPLVYQEITGSQPEELLKVSGTTRLHKNLGVVWFAGNQNEYAKFVRSEIAKLMIEEMFYGGEFSNTVQNKILLYLPPWYLGGISAYVGEGWSATDEQKMRSFANHDLIELSLRNDGSPRERLVHKSYWHFVAKTYGVSKISEIIYMTRLTRSVEAGIIAVLGLRLDALTTKWLDYCKTQFSDNFHDPMNFRLVELDLTSAKQRLVTATISPNGDNIAFITEHNGHFRINVYQPKTGKIYNTKLTAGTATDEKIRLYEHYPIAFSKDNQILACILPKKNYPELIFYYLESGAIERINLESEIQGVRSIAWGTGNKLVLSAYKSGKTDLFLASPGKALARLTNDFYDEVEPVFSPDGKEIIFSSNRISDTLDFNFHKHCFDLYSLQLAGKLIHRLTNTPVYDERYPQFIDTTLVYLSNESGIFNLKHRNGNYLTNYSNGFEAISTSKRGFLGESYYEGKKILYLRDSLDLTTDLKWIPLPIVEDMVLSAQLLFRKKQSTIPVETILKDASDTTEIITADPVEVKDSTHKKESAKYYVFDEEDTVVVRKERKVPLNKPKKKKENKSEKPKIQPFDINLVKISRPQVGLPTAYIYEVGTRFGFHQLIRPGNIPLSLDFRLSFKDPQNRHRLMAGFMPFIDFRSSILYLQYRYLARRIDYTATVSKTSRFFKDNLIRYNDITTTGTISYPFNRFHRVDLSANYSFIQRYDLKLNDAANLDGSYQTSSLLLEYRYNRVLRKDNFVRRGIWLRLSAQPTYSITESKILFTTLKADLRKYTSFLNHIVLVTRFNAGVSLGEHRQRFLLGGLDNCWNCKTNNSGDFSP
ncbi:MAG: hypothetical protein NZ108_01680, partial [Bacteroidia bacterium]|nr:hypothetical protein [Bacteroidia bacterium]